MELLTDVSLAKSETCPNCHNEIPVNPGYVTWCDKCNWNVSPGREAVDIGYYEKIYFELSNTFGQTLLEQMQMSQIEKPKLSFSTCVAYAIASIIHCISLVILCTGVILLVTNWHSFFYIIGALICFIVAWITRPIMGKVPSDILPRGEFPTLYQVIDDIGSVLHSPPIYGIRINHEFNASFSQHGFGRKRVLSFGLPLLSVLNSDEKVALIAHEIGHGVNGDANRSLFVGTAIRSLAQWSKLIKPDEIWEREGNLVSLAMIPIHLLMYAISKILDFILIILCSLLCYDSQKAEYMADYLACKASGTTAKLSLLEKLHLDYLYQFAITKCLSTKEGYNYFQVLKEMIQSVPERERERIQRIEMTNGSRLDSTHPPTIYRMEFLRGQFINEPMYMISKENGKHLHQELQTLENKVQKQLIDEYKGNLYY